MKQLLGDKALSADKSFLHELFLQRLPPHVLMVLASSRNADDLEELAGWLIVAEVSFPLLTPQACQWKSNSFWLRLRVWKVLFNLSHNLCCLVYIIVLQTFPDPELVACVGIMLVLLRRPTDARNPARWVWKRPGQSLMAANATDQFFSRLLFMLERVSHHHFLVNTGVEISVVPSDRKCCQTGVTSGSQWCFYCNFWSAFTHS